MKPSCRYAKRSHFSEPQFRHLVKLFALDLNATQITKLMNANRNTINRYLSEMRRKLAAFCEAESPFSGEVEVDESYFGAKRVRGKRGRGAFGKTIVFGIFRRNGCVYTEIVPNCRQATLQAVIRGRVSLESVIHSDGWRGYNGLVDLGYKKHYRVDHGRDEFANERSHINGIENFWSLAKTRMAKFRGMNKSTFYLHLKECEFRYNHRHDNLYHLMLKIFRKSPLF